jgi:hypothetical protein
MLHYIGDEPIIIEQFSYGFEGVIMGLIMGSQNIMGSDYGSNISGCIRWVSGSLMGTDYLFFFFFWKVESRPI